MADEPTTNTNNVQQQAKEDVADSSSTSDRTSKEFEKLKKSNQELKKERDAIQKAHKDVLSSLKPDNYQPQQSVQPPSAQNYNNLDQKQVDDVYADLIDENGYVDVNKLKDTLNQANRTAAMAVEEARKANQRAEQAQISQQDFEKTTEMSKVHKKYPQIDPESPSFDNDLYEDVRTELVKQMLDGKPENVMMATEIAYKRRYGNKKQDGDDMAKEENKKEEQDNKEARRQINQTPTGGANKSQYTAQDFDALVQGTRKGDSSAIAERLKRSGY